MGRIRRPHTPEELERIKEKRDKLFETHIRPNFETIRSLTAFYTDRKQEEEANFNYVISQMYRYIYTYNPKRSLKTWIHIVTKRCCYNQNKFLAKHNALLDGMQFRADGELPFGGETYEMNSVSLADNLSDKVYRAMINVPAEYLSSFLLYLDGYSPKEIAEIEFEKKLIPRYSEDLIKKKLTLCKKLLREELEKNGVTRESRKSGCGGR